MSQQQPNESKPSQKGSTGNVSPKPDKSNEILHKTGHQSGPQAGQQAGQHSGQDSQQRRDAHSNSAAAGREEEDAEETHRGQHGSTDSSRGK